MVSQHEMLFEPDNNPFTSNNEDVEDEYDDGDDGEEIEIGVEVNLTLD